MRRGAQLLVAGMVLAALGAGCILVDSSDLPSNRSRHSRGGGQDVGVGGDAGVPEPGEAIDVDAGPGAFRAEPRRSGLLRVANRSTSRIVAVYIRRSGRSNWGADRLQDEVIEIGGTWDFTLPVGSVDVMCGDDDEETSEIYDVTVDPNRMNVCTFTD